ncbi:MAG TPA: GTPase domain-containing protein [Candidatus Saccharimonadales bacterium]|nr:GTPase domain-containing protein [Candidatus Saccharimonadales bacterium]
MVVVSYSGREINAKIVYYGPGLSGKTTNLEKIYDSVPETNRGRMVSMKTQTDRTLFFDLLPLDLGDLQGMKTRLLLYTVPGQVYYNATRKLVLKGVDAVVFVADSAADKMAENRESFANLEQNLKAYGIDIKTIPLVLQYNKRDLPTALPVAELNKELNRLNVPTYEAQAANGIGVFETLRGVSKLLLAKITKDVLEKDKGAVQGLARAKEKAAKAEASAAAAKKQQEQEKPSSGGKLLKYLKRGKGQDEPAEMEAEAPAEEPARGASPAMFEPTPLLGDEALMDDAPVAEMPAPLNAEEELVLTEEDMIPHAPPGAPPLPVEPARAPMVGARSSDEESLGDFERDPGVPSSGFSRQVSATTSVPGDGRRVSVPIDLGALPRSGKVTLMVEISIRVESDEPAPKKIGGGKKAEGFDDSFTRDLEPIP